MKINLSNKSVIFEKKLCATTTIKKSDGTNETCSIYNLTQEDKGYYKNLQNKEEWKNNYWLRNMENFLNNTTLFPNKKIYTLENSNEDCLAYMTTNENSSFIFRKSKPLNCYLISFLEVAPSYQNNKKNIKTKYKYLGETMLAFIAKKATNENKNWIELNSELESIYFYKKCHFNNYHKHKSDMTLEKQDFPKLILQNTNHNGKEIDIIT